MKKRALEVIISVLLMSITVQAGGGKQVVPPEAIVEPIPPMETPMPVYIGLGVVEGRYSGCDSYPGCKYADITYGVLMRVGYEWSQYIGVEARILSTSLDVDPNGGEKMQHMGIFVKPMYPVNDDLDLYALLGYGWTKSTTKSIYLRNVDETGLSAGFGVEYDLSSKEDDREEDVDYDRPFDGQADQEKGWGLYADYQRLLIKSGAPNMDIISGGVTYDF